MFRKFVSNALGKILSVLLAFSLLVLNTYYLIPNVVFASSPWTQTDWVGGSGQTSWPDSTKFANMNLWRKLKFTLLSTAKT